MTIPRVTLEPDAPDAGRFVVSLDDPRAVDPDLVGAKAANLARSRQLGLPVLPGLVVTTECSDLAALGPLLDDTVATLGGGASVVRSSSTVEDIGTSSMAGQFRSVLNVVGPAALLDAVHEVRASARRPDGSAAPMGVLVQPQVDAAVGGVLFGVDPVTGDDRHVVIEVVVGNPDQLVSGQVSAQRLLVSRAGRLLAVNGVATHHMPGRRTLLTRTEIRDLAKLAAALERSYGSPQDVEWALDSDRHLILLQNRPVTTRVAPATGPVLGPGPVAETFPYPLRPLECQLWLDPMRTGVRTALTTTGVVPRHVLETSPVLVDVGGWPAADLELFGYLRLRPHGWRWLDPRPPARRLAAAWRIGGLRARLTDEVQSALSAADAQLTAVHRLPDLSSEHLLDILASLQPLLVDLHTLEVLAASLSSTTRGTLAGSALQALRQGRLAGLSDATITARHPVVLSLTPPRIGEPWPLPQGTSLTPIGSQAPPGLRELLRLRVRWVQELHARVAGEIGRRAGQAGHLPDPEAVAWLTMDELTALVRTASVPADLDGRCGRRPTPPLPTHFRMSTDGSVVPVERPGARPAGGVGAGGGRGTGTVAHADTLAAERPGSLGRVLVVRTLDPTLAVWLPSLTGLVAESGSTLSHLAILAREYGVPTVVAVHDAVHHFPVGASLLVDGQTGEVRLLDEEAP